MTRSEASTVGFTRWVGGFHLLMVLVWIGLVVARVLTHRTSLLLIATVSAFGVASHLASWLFTRTTRELIVDQAVELEDLRANTRHARRDPVTGRFARRG